MTAGSSTAEPLAILFPRDRRRWPSFPFSRHCVTLGLLVLIVRPTDQPVYSSRLSEEYIHLELETDNNHNDSSRMS